MGERPYIPLEDDPIKVWDSRYFRQRDAFSVYRECVASNLVMPWSAERVPGAQFQLRMERRLLEKGPVANGWGGPSIALKTKSDIAKASLECFSLVYVWSGAIAVEQNGDAFQARKGDAIIFDSAKPSRLSSSLTGNRVLGLSFPKSAFSPMLDLARYGNALRGQAMIPLLACFELLDQGMLAAPREELDAIYDACIPLIPLALESSEVAPGPKHHNAHRLCRDILRYIDDNVGDPDLSPPAVARVFGISERYLHKLFAGSTMTFSNYVSATRLANVCGDLRAYVCRHKPIAEIAYRWGFNDLSTFNRAFKRRYGCTAKIYRTRFSLGK